MNFRKKTTNSHCLEAFIEKIEESIFQPTNVNKKVFHNITREERDALKEIKMWEYNCIRVQGKGSRFAVIANNEYVDKVYTQINRGSFSKLLTDVTKTFENKVNDFVDRWVNLKVLNEKWAKYIRSNYCKPGTMYGLIKTHKENNPARVITSGCGTAIEYLSIFVEKYLYKEVDKLCTRIKDTPDMLNIIDEINNSFGQLWYYQYVS